MKSQTANAVKYVLLAAFTVGLVAFLVSYGIGLDQKSNKELLEKRQKEQEVYDKAFFDAARVYGRAGCDDQHLTDITALASIRTGLPARVIAAEVSVESLCDPLAVGKGTVGLMQINVKTWAPKYEQFCRINLFNPDQNLAVGVDILNLAVKQYGLPEGVEHFNGSGPASRLYAAKVLKLAGIK